MLGDYAKYIEELYDRADSILIIDDKGYVEYCATYDQEEAHLAKDNFIGKHIFEVYPELNEEVSTHFRVMRTAKPIINEEQTLTDLNGNTFSLINSTFPITVEGGSPLGTIELSKLISMNHKKFSGKKQSEILGTWHRQELYSLDSIITCDPRMLQLKEEILRFSGSTSNAMIWGETGTGKELVAESIHSLGSRKDGPFITVNCSAIPATLVESMLFGTAKGSFTGAKDNKGFVEMANGGTLFLDELNSMDIDMQPKLLQVIERQRVRRIGEEKERAVNVRFLAAMNVDPETAIKDGILRQDLFYRLCVMEFHLPPLRERPDDILLLSKFYLDYYNKALGKNIRGISTLAQNALKTYDYPGNVRELRNAIEYAVNMATTQISMTDLPQRITGGREDVRAMAAGGLPRIPDGPFSLADHMNSYEKSILLTVLNTSSSITDAGRRLGLSRQALQYKMQKFGIRWEK